MYNVNLFPFCHKFFLSVVEINYRRSILKVVLPGNPFPYTYQIFKLVSRTVKNIT